MTDADVAELFAEDMLGGELKPWMRNSSLLKRTFRNVAVIAGLIERNHPGEAQERPAGDLQLRPDLRGAEVAPAGSHPVARHARRRRAGLTDVRRVADLLSRAKGPDHAAAPGPGFALPALPVLLEIGRESVWGEARDALLAEAEEALVREATG